VRASAERAFEVFTRDIGVWWRPNALFGFTADFAGVLSFEPGVGGRFLETAGDGRFFEIGRLPHGNLAPGWLSRSGKRPLSPNKRDRLEADGTAIIID
jgi:hypothetical protein